MSSLLPPQVAASLAQSSYTVEDSTTPEAALDRVKRTDPLRDVSAPDKAGKSAEARKAMVAKTGTSSRDFGFGVVYDYGSGGLNHTVIAFRGTKFTRMSDWITNAQIVQVAGVAGFALHRGFAECYKQMQSDVNKIVNETPGRPVHFIGHSLGGAIATIAAADVARAGTVTPHLYTFGCPRLGGPAMEMAMRRLVPADRIRTVFDIADPVAQIPFFPFYPLSHGALALNGGGPLISVAAHSMQTSYIPQLKGSSWPTSVQVPLKTVDQLLDLAEAHDGTLSGRGYYFLGMALRKILAIMEPGAFMVNLGASAGFALLDYMAYLLASGAASVVRVGDAILRFVKIALRIVGLLSWSATVSMADLTRRFFRFLFDRLAQPVLAVARSAVASVA